MDDVHINVGIGGGDPALAFQTNGRQGRHNGGVVGSPSLPTLPQQGSSPHISPHHISSYQQVHSMGRSNQHQHQPQPGGHNNTGLGPNYSHMPGGLGSHIYPHGMPKYRQNGIPPSIHPGAQPGASGGHHPAHFANYNYGMINGPSTTSSPSSSPSPINSVFPPGHNPEYDMEMLLTQQHQQQASVPSHQGYAAYYPYYANQMQFTQPPAFSQSINDRAQHTNISPTRQYQTPSAASWPSPSSHRPPSSNGFSDSDDSSKPLSLSSSKRRKIKEEVPSSAQLEIDNGSSSEYDDDNPNEAQYHAASTAKSRGPRAHIDISPYLNMPQKEAARRLGIPVSTLSKRWKDATHDRKWPFRTIAKLDKEIMSILNNVSPDEGLSTDDSKSVKNLLKQRIECLSPVMLKM